MKKIKITCRQIIYKNHQEIHNDEGMKVLNGYLESEWISIDENENLDSLIEEFLISYPQFRNSDIRIEYSE